MSEAKLIRRAQRGDGDAFECLYKIHSRRIFALCLRMTGNAAEAEDLTQEAFLQVFRKVESFRGDSAFSTWLYRLTINVVLMRLRKRSLPETSLEQLTEADEESGGPHRDFGVTDPWLTGLFDRLNLERALDQLSPGYQSVFVLHDIEGYAHDEIAVIKNCSVGNSKSQLHKARGRLRELLQESLRMGWLNQTDATLTAT